ncbi:MAG: hypothetical protein ACP5JG_04920 [Anaerolineae bacterium]
MSSRDGYLGRLRNFWFPNGFDSFWWLIFALPPLHFLQTLIHEGSHGLAALVASGEFPKLAPFPHYNAAFDSFLNGVAFTGGRGFVAAPQFIDLALIAAFTLIFVFWPIRNHLPRFLLRTWYVGVCIDLLYNTVKGLWGGSSPSSDWGKFEAQTSTPGIIVLTWIIWLLVLSHFLWVYFSAWGRRGPERMSFWGYRWVAVVFGLLSLTSILVSAFVSDPQIVKDHAYFIVPLTSQGLALLWYVTYVPLTYYYT